MTTRASHIKNYINGLFAVEDDVLKAVKKQANQAGLPQIEVPSNVGKLLYCLAKIQRPQRVLEIGTLAGYSTVWLARALEEGAKLISLELQPEHLAIARQSIQMAGLNSRVELREGDARVLIDQMIQQKEKPFDLIFIDADKKSYPVYLDKVLQLSHPGTLILSDNLIPKGEEIGTPVPENWDARGIYTFNQAIATHPRLESILATTIVGDSGRIDALGISIVK